LSDIFILMSKATALFAGVWFYLHLSGAASADPFRSHVAPILERSCIGCHGPESPKGRLSLATRATALKGGRRGPAFVPGKPGESLILALASGEKKPRMPQDGEPLAAEELEAIRAWIEAGALWPEGLVLADRSGKAPEEVWWSLRTLVRPPPPTPEGRDSEWVRTPVDAFVIHKLREKGLGPSPEADRRTLIRRLIFDLHGLPPAPEEVEAFAADSSPGAYEQLVDRLVASPRYGERWGRHWLDIVHYGETHGYDKDKRRPNAWPYRDYVIRAFNEDKPYSRFVEEQIAGDVLYPDEPDGIVATGFIAAGPWDFVGHVELREGTADKLIARSNDRDDMLSTAISTFASTTAHCARCHDHKFDPIPQEDYYRLQAVFAGVDRADRPHDPERETLILRRELAREKEELEARKRHLDVAVAQVSRGLPEIGELDARLAELGRRRKALSGPRGEPSPTNGYHSAIMPEPDVEKWVEVDLGRAVALDEIRIIAARPTDFPDSPGFGFPARFRVEVAGEPGGPRRTIAEHTAEDFPNPGDEPVILAAPGIEARTVRVTATRLWKRTGDWVFALAELEVRSGGENLALGAAVTALDSIEAGRWSTRHLVDGYSSRRRLAGAESEPAGAARREALEEEAAAATARRQALLDEVLDPALKEGLEEVRRRLADAGERIARLPPQAMVFAAARRFAPEGNFTAPSAPRPIHFLHRGDVKTPGELMAPGALSCLKGLERHFELSDPGDEGSRRAALAKWLTDPENVLARRSIANRIWQYHFGRGLVETPNDFGRMGALPTHPELLDWLAVELFEGGESLKQLHRLILISAVYRQSSRDHLEHSLIDADNRYLWRMNRLRLDAESIRDAMLEASGSLDLTMGGPSVDHFHFKDDHSPVYDYTRFDVDSPASRRRSVYRFIVRSVPDPFLDCFDCADPSLLTPKRNTTLTALQALALLNNPFAVRQAVHLAARARREGGPSGEADRAFELALGRPPETEESAMLAAYAREHGLESACRLLFNANEFLFID
jgi:hypothetical protein